MHLIFGGAYQGKLAFAKAKYQFPPEAIFTCTPDSGVDFSYPCITGLWEYAYGCACRGEDVTAVFRENRRAWENAVLICRDLSAGVVPLGAENRAWREVNGQLCQYLAGEAQQVSRIFCGLEQRIK